MIEGTDLLTFVCSHRDGVQTEIEPPAKLRPIGSLLADKAFDAETTRVLGSAFDAAWEKVEATNILPTDKRAGCLNARIARQIRYRESRARREKSQTTY